MTAERRVLQVVQPVRGGVPEHALHLARGLLERDWQVEVATGPENVIRGPLADAGIPVHVVPLTRGPHRADVEVARALRRLDRERRYSIVHAHSSKSGALVRLVMRDRRRLVYTPHLCAFLAGFSAPSRAAYWLAERALVAKTGALVAVSRWEEERYARALPGIRGRLHAIHNGVPACPEVAADQELLDFKGELPLAGFITRFDPPKQPLPLIRAAKLLADRGAPPFRLALVGSGPQETEIEAEIARLGMEDRVRLFPFRGSPWPYVRALDMFVFASGWESLPLAVLEALACGVPVIAADVGGLGEAVGPGVGRLVGDPTPEGFAAAIGELLSLPGALDSLGEAARRSWLEKFTVELLVERVEGLYAQLLASGEQGDTADIVPACASRS